jgi:hypothetical protein
MSSVDQDPFKGFPIQVLPARSPVATLVNGAQINPDGDWPARAQTQQQRWSATGRFPFDLIDQAFGL